MAGQMTLERQAVLVTGASGFIGSHLCAKLMDMGAIVHGVSRSERGSEANGMRWWTSSLQEEDKVIGLLKAVKPDIIFHLSACVTGSRDPSVILPTFRSNLASTVTLLAALRQTGCGRVVLAGSMEEPLSGGTEPSSISPYAASKWAGSTYGRMFHALYGLPIVILHLFMVYGPGHLDPKKLVPYVTLSFLKNEVPGLSSGKRQADWVYIDDVVDGLVAGARVAGIAGQTFDIGTGTLTSVSGIVERLRVLTKTNVLPLFGAQADRPYENVRVADVTRSCERLGWKSRVDVGDGLRRTVDWYRERTRKGDIA